MSQTEQVIELPREWGQRQDVGCAPEINEAKLERLEAACERVRERCPDLPLLAIRWMYLRHPVHPLQEALLRDDAGPGPGGWRMTILWPTMDFLRRAVLCVLYAAHLSGRLMSLQVAMRHQRATLKRQSFDVIAKTYCLGLERLPDDRDFYYGDLSQRLAHRGIRMLLLCGDVRNGGWRAFARAHVSTSPVCRLPELCLVSPLAPWRMMGRQFASSWRLARLATRVRDPLERRIIRLASRECLAPDTLCTGLTFWMAHRAVRIWHPRAFLTFYEGHAWERCVWRGVKAADASCRTVGYQHTSVFRESLTVTSPSGDATGRLLPELVLCLGSVPLDLMRAGHRRYPVRLLRFGSFRSQGPAAAGPADPMRRTVLVTPEAIESEACALFAHASACAKRLPSYTFILRMFPGVPLPRAAEAAKQYVAHQPNLVISERSDIQEDFRRASVMLYRGSSAVLYATRQGLLPVYVRVEGLIDSDPLYRLSTWKAACASPEGFAAVVETYEQMSAQAREAAWRVAADYVGRYAEPVREEAVEEFLAAVGFGEPATNGGGTHGLR